MEIEIGEREEMEIEVGERKEMEIEVGESQKEILGLEIEGEERERKVVLSVRNLSKKFGERVIFENLSFDCLEGSRLFLRGPSGCGKSTLLRALAALDIGEEEEFIQGSVSSPLLCLSPHNFNEIPDWRSEVLWVSQSRITRNGSPNDLFHLACSFDSQKKRQHEHGDLEETAMKLGLSSHFLNQNWATLSGGEAQRCLICLCVCLKPKVLLLDEPTSSLDVESTGLVESLIQETGITCVWVTHDPQQQERVGGDLLVLGEHSSQPEIFVTLKEKEEGEGEENLQDSIKRDEEDNGLGLKREEKREELKIEKKGGVKKSLLEEEEEWFPFRSVKNSFNNFSEMKYVAPAVLFFAAILILLWQQFDLFGYSFLHSDDTEGEGPVSVSIPLLLGSFLASLVLVLSLSKILRLHIGRSIIIAASRATIQLTILGFILVPIFRYDNPFFVCGYIFLMVVIASREALNRIKNGYPRLALHVLLAISLSLVIIASSGLAALGVGLAAQYAIPISGMLLGNMMSGCSLSLNTLLNEFHDHGQNTEVLLCLGATRFEASYEALRQAIHMGLTPTIQSLAVLGLVSIPGMMTGQILGGTMPEEAARYQLMIYFMIVCTASICMISVNLCAVLTLVDAAQRLRTDLVKKKEKMNNPWSVLILGHHP